MENDITVKSINTRLNEIEQMGDYQAQLSAYVELRRKIEAFLIRTTGTV